MPLFAEMDVVLLSRIQFALTIMFHYLFPPLTIGMSVVLNVLAVANIARCVYLRQIVQAFASSCLNIFCLVSLVGVALFPSLVRASNLDANSLTIYNAASSEKTLWIMLIFAGIGMPLVASYTALVYWTFRGKADTGGYG